MHVAWPPPTACSLAQPWGRPAAVTHRRSEACNSLCNVEGEDKQGRWKKGEKDRRRGKGEGGPGGLGWGALSVKAGCMRSGWAPA
jgi:hypothetical protein